MLSSSVKCQIEKKKFPKEDSEKLTKNYKGSNNLPIYSNPSEHFLIADPSEEFFQIIFIFSENNWRWCGKMNI